MSFDWRTGTWRRSEAAGNASIMVTADWAPYREYENLIIADPENIYGDLLELIRGADLAITNVECALGEAGEPIKKSGPNIRGSARAAGGLTAAGFGVATLANNHIFDYDVEGFRVTVDLLERIGVQTVGAGLNEQDAWTPLRLNVGEANVAIINMAEGEDGLGACDGRAGVAGWDPSRAAELAAAARETADVVLVIVHAGREHVPVPPPYIVEAYHQIAAAGADAVIAHHPHVPQGVEIYQGVPIIYSMGNFIFFQKPDCFYRKSGYMTELRLDGKQLAGLRIHPYLIGPTGLRLLAGEEKRFILGRLEYVSGLLTEAANVRAAWEAYLDWMQAGGEPNMGHILDWIQDSMKTDLPLGAARLRNLFVAPSSRHMWIDACSRIVRGELNSAPDWANELVADWMSLPVAAGLAGGKR